MLLWLQWFNEYNRDVTMHRPNVWTLRCSAFIITPDEGLIVRLVALRTLKQISFSLLPKMTPDRQARNFLTCRISNVRLLHLAGQTSGDEIIYLWFKGDTTNQSFCSIQLANCNFFLYFSHSRPWFFRHTSKSWLQPVLEGAVFVFGPSPYQ